MGQCLSSQINMLLIKHLKSLVGNGKDSFTVHKYEQDFFLNGSPDSPQCNILVQNLSIEAPDELGFEESEDIDEPTIVMKAPKIFIQIGKATVRCDSIGYSCDFFGKIVIEGVTAGFTTSVDPLENELKIENVFSNVKKIKSDIELSVNGFDYSKLGNAFLSTNNPDLVNSVLEDISKVLSETVKKIGNEFLTDLNLASILG